MRRIFLFCTLILLGALCLAQTVFAQNYEVLFDSATSTVVKIYSESGDGYLIEGENNSTDTWEAVHDSQSARFVDYTSEMAQVYSGEPSWGALTYVIGRTYISFNADNITQDIKLQNILSARVGIKVKSSSNSDDDGLDYISIVKSFANSNSELVGSDYEDCGYDLNNKISGRAKYTPIVKGSDSIDYSLFQNESYVEFNLNSNGISWIFDNISSIKFGIREGHDLENEKYDGVTGGKNKVYFYMSEAGESNAPYLLIHYTKKQNEPVIVVPGIAGSWYSSKDGWLMDPILHTYDDLLDTLRANGYEDDKTLFPLPYNWRQDNTFSAYELGQKIDYAISTSGSDKVDIVAHSMGGLVARKYLSNPENLDKVDDLIFLGTPHQGAPKAYPIWEAATGFNSLSDRALRDIIKFEAESSGETVLEYIRNGISSLKQLLPTYKYLQDGSTWRDYDSVNSSNNYPYNLWLENLNSDSNLLSLNNSDVDIYNLRGDSNGTITLYEVSDINLSSQYWPHGEVVTSYKGAGDGTVPEASSNLFTSTVVPGSSHRLLPTESREQVITILTDTATSVAASEIPAVEHLMTVGVYSPVDFLLMTPDGQKIGRDLPSNNEINEIPLAFYSGVENDNEFATLLNPIAGEYTMEVFATDNGKYKIGVDVASDLFGESLNNYKSGTILLGESEIYKIRLSYDEEKTPLVEITKEIDDTDYFEHVDKLCLNGEINKRAVCQYLKVKYRFLEKKINFYNNTNKDCLKKAIKHNIQLTLRDLKYKLEFFKKKNWISTFVYNLLIKDLNMIADML